MKIRFCSLSLVCIILFVVSGGYAEDSKLFPVRGIHFTSVGKNNLDLCNKFIREELPKQGVNVMVLEIDYDFQFKSHPELASTNALSIEDVKSIVSACKDAKVRLIPQFNCLGHQSWDKHTFPLLTKYPEFDETPGMYPQNKDIYCRSYCPLHPKVHEVIFAMIDELLEAFEADAMHVGMDEVFLLGEDSCPRCQGKDKAELFAQEVNTLYNHLVKSNKQLWMWSDRYLNGKITGLGEWEASFNKTERAIDLVPKDIVMCDWHYEFASSSSIYFAMKGFPVLSCPWRKTEVALNQFELLKLVRANDDKKVANRLQGMLHTTWCGMAPFVNAY